MSAHGLADNLRFLRALIARPKHIGAVMPSGPALAAAMAAQIDLLREGPVLELGPGTGVITSAILARGIDPARLIAVEYDEGFAGALKVRFPAVRVIQGDAFDLTRTLDRFVARTDAARPSSIVSGSAADRAPQGARELAPFAAILSGLPLLNFPHAARKRLVEGALARLAPDAPFIQFSYGLHSPVAPPAGYSVLRAAFVLRNIPPARVWVYRKI